MTPERALKVCPGSTLHYMLLLIYVSNAIIVHLQNILSKMSEYISQCISVTETWEQKFAWRFEKLSVPWIKQASV